MTTNKLDTVRNFIAAEKKLNSTQLSLYDRRIWKSSSHNLYKVSTKQLRRLGGRHMFM